MNDNTAAVLMLVAFLTLFGFICWLREHYLRSSCERENSVYKWTITQAQPGRIAPPGNIECASPRSPKPVPPVRPAQPNRRKKKKARK